MSSPPLSVKVMGVLNATPDSFSDGGRFADLDAALARARQLIADGADIVDVGGESTRPGAEPVGEDEEISRVEPLIRALNPAPDSLATAAALGCDVVLMHMQGEPGTMQAEPRYDDVVAEVAAFLAGRAEAAMAAGVLRQRIWVDPGIGFGKHMTAHNLPLLGNLDRIVALGFPVLLGASRKSFISALDDASRPADERLGGSIAAALAGAAAGVAAVRVHDVRETVQALRVWTAIGQAGRGG
jgi:dihydropteroate synthase